MASPEAARALLAKARQDEYVLQRFLTDTAAADEIFGFHAQQAVEKLLKAALACRGIAYPRTHRLAQLLDLARDHGVVVPTEFEDTRMLTPFAVEYRYEFFAEETERPLERDAIHNQVVRLRLWVETLFAAEG